VDQGHSAGSDLPAHRGSGADAEHVEAEQLCLVSVEYAQHLQTGAAVAVIASAAILHEELQTAGTDALGHGLLLQRAMGDASGIQ